MREVQRRGSNAMRRNWIFRRDEHPVQRGKGWRKAGTRGKQGRGVKESKGGGQKKARWGKGEWLLKKAKGALYYLGKNCGKFSVVEVMP